LRSQRKSSLFLIGNENESMTLSTKDIYETITDIEISLMAENLPCWESPVCPYCMIKQLKAKLKKEINE